MSISSERSTWRFNSNKCLAFGLNMIMVMMIMRIMLMMVMILIMKVMTTMADVDEVDVFSCSSLSFVLVVFSLCLPFPRSRPLVLVIVEPHQGARHPSQSKSVVPEAWPYGGARLRFLVRKQQEDPETVPAEQPSVL